MSGPPSATAPQDAERPGTRLEEHFEFGANWRRFLAHVDDRRIETAEASLRAMLGLGDGPTPLDGTRFLDAGSGSGLFSLAAHKLGASVTSFDFDPQSVACAEELRKRYAANDAGGDTWRITTGSVLDRSFLDSLGDFETVYSWGVLHHTGAMWDALAAVSTRVLPGGNLFIAIYNDQGRLSDVWTAVKRVYGRLPRALRKPYAAGVGAVYFGGKAAGRLALLPARFVSADGVRRPRASSPYKLGERGMSRWYDLVDWVGGYPFEVASVGELVDAVRPLGFTVEKVRDVGGRLGCNELVFRRGEAA